MAYDLSTNYDENLMNNAFFQTLQKEFNELFLKAILEGCIICVPRNDSLPKYILALEDFLTHILVPTDELPESHFRNLCGAEIKISNRIINVDHEVGRQTSIHILFQETFYTKDGLKYEVLCVEQPFDEEISVSQNGTTVLKNLRDCLDLLWTETGGHETVELIDKEINEFLKKNPNIDFSSLQIIKNSVDSLYTKCVHILLKNNKIKKKYKTEKNLINNLKIGVEAYMQHGIYKAIIKGISTCTAFEDAQLNKIVRNFSDMHFKDFSIKIEFYDCIPKARLELSRINGYSTTLGKTECLRRTVIALSNSKIKKAVLNADNLLQILSFLIIKTNLPNWNAQLRFLKLFQISNSDEYNFLITSLEAAITYVQNGVFSETNYSEGQKVIYKENLKNSEIQSMENLNEKASTWEKAIHEFFHQIAIGNLEKAKQILENNTSAMNDYSSLNLCHPLCTCDKCSGLIKINIYDVAPTIKSCDDQGLTALHIASMYGVPNIVEYLLAQSADVNASDCNGRIPLHYAALKGHQNALLLLIHHNADLNALDNSSNTPLHLCANNGHENCVKALIYFSEHLEIKLKINQQNAKGDTPLHNAANWGYLGIVKILLEYEASPTILNKKKFSPIDYAHNMKISQLLKQNCQNGTHFIKIKSLNPTFDLSEQNNKPNQLYKGIQPNTMNLVKQVDKVLKATENGDINLVCYYLNIETSEFEKDWNILTNSPGEKNNQTKCHPLCICPKCGHPENGILIGRKVHKKKGLNVNICNSEGYTPLHAGAKFGHLDLVKGFIRNGAILDAQTTNLLTPLMLACQNQKLHIVKELLDSGCKIDMQDYKLNTALHYAVCTENSKLVEILVKYEPNIDLKNFENKTAVKIAKEKVLIGILQILKGGKPFEFDEI